MHLWLPDIPVWEKILRSFVIYAFLLVAFRLTGKRQVAQMTPFDLIVLLIISNVLQNAMIGDDVSILGGVIGATTIFAANWVVGYMALSSRRVERVIEGLPTVLVHNGRIIEQNLKKEEFSHDELNSVLRSEGYFELKNVRLAILEPSGKISVLGYEGKKGQESPGGGAA